MAAKILIVEDQNAFMLRELLELYGHFEFDIAGDGPTAIEKLAGPLPDLILLDLRLPGIGGLAVLDAIRAADSCLPVIVVTAYGDKRTRQEAARRGADGFFLKPVNVARLYQQMRILLAMHLPHQIEEALQIKSRRDQLVLKTRRLNKLRERQALLGIDAPPELLIEIEDLERDLEDAHA